MSRLEGRASLPEFWMNSEIFYFDHEARARANHEDSRTVRSLSDAQRFAEPLMVRHRNGEFWGLQFSLAIEAPFRDAFYAWLEEEETRHVYPPNVFVGHVGN